MKVLNAPEGELGIRNMSLMADTGLAHHHIWLERDDIDWVARLPKQSQLGLSTRDNLHHQAACFARAAKSGHTPELQKVLPPSQELPRGGLLVSAIHGRPARLPEDLPAIAEALAALHRLDLPSMESRPPIASPADAWGTMREEIERQALWLSEADLDDGAFQLIQQLLRDLPVRLPDEVRSLISFDAHPGNFLITDSGHAVLVDLEKCRYGLPGFDLAHASLYTSTTWDIHHQTELDIDQIAAFYRHWQQWFGRACHPQTLLACRKAMWLWSLTWCAKWQTQHDMPQDREAQGEDWSAELSADSLVTHVRDRAAHYLDPQVIRRIRDEFPTLRDILNH